MKTPEQKASYFKGRRNSFYYAFRGLRSLMATEPNARIHLLATAMVTALGIYFPLSLTDWAVLIVVMGMVWVAELFNTCIEKIMDLVHPQKDERVGVIKDLAAAAVLFTAVIAVLAGCFVFLPHFFR